MIELYRASAGSGKTYTLAKKYIWYYITITDENRKSRLRTVPELADSARHILAVTFTNKATNEMQMRIVDSLYALAFSPVEYKTDEDGAKTIASPVYMKDFVQELGETPENISKVCAIALSILLENYSDFNVSTIDSFFQQVLRTFAYESEINDAYQVELDSKYLSEVGVDETLEEIDSNSSDVHTAFWLKTIMDRTEQGKWNIFSRSSGEYGDNPYKAFISSVMKMETEQYKLIRKDVEDYFRLNEGKDNFIRLYRDLSEKYERPVRSAFMKLREAADNLKRSLPPELAEASTRSAIGKFSLVCRELLDRKMKWDTFPSGKWVQYLDYDYLNNNTVAKWLKKNPEAEFTLESLFKSLCDAFENWSSLISDEEFAHWKLYSVNLPFYALFDIVTRKRRDYLEEANAIELAETSMILKGVIDGDNTPFVYERLGTRLNHFLIDEFQDTSKMQWENLCPMLDESISRQNGNLIIGDAKQSIYRFRNADSSLITHAVSSRFGKNVVPRGFVPSENTNYRSDLQIVRFNNSLFKYLAETIDSETPDPAGTRIKFKDIYSNVVQNPNKKKDSGYVELRCSDETGADMKAGVLQQLPGLVADLIKRDYRQKDIAVLVATNDEGSEVIGALVDYNLNRGESEPEIRFVSEQSLKVSSSRAVNIIVGVLYNMAKGSNPEIREGEERRIKGVADWSDMMANFKFYQMRYPDTPVSELLDSYFKVGSDFNALSDLLSEMQSLAIPALVEAVASSFVEESLRKRDALYIAAFQDIVLEYCESHPTDIGSFLKWWERRSKSASVSSPEDTDAVQVVTVHKSKGLQYKCVVIPFSEWEMKDVNPSAGKKEWLWVQPQVISHDTVPLPPYIPVETSSDLALTRHAPLLYNYYDVSKMDRLNSAYVAFTRAEKELYVFTSPKGVGPYLRNFISSLTEGSLGDEYEGFALLNPSSVRIENDGMIIKIGNIQKTVSSAESSLPVTLLETYDANPTPEFLKYREDNLPSEMSDSDIAAEEEDLDPRSEGNIKHAVLELVNVASDVPASVKKLCLRGVIPDNMAENVLESLQEAVHRKEVSRWFDGSARIINERPVLKRGYVTRRPDRLLLYPDGSVEVVDYKFGKIDDSGKYKRQIAGYMKRLSETGSYKSVKGFIWYVNEDAIQEVSCI